MSSAQSEECPADPPMLSHNFVGASARYVILTPTHQEPLPTKLREAAPRQVVESRWFVIGAILTLPCLRWWCKRISPAPCR